MKIIKNHIFKTFDFQQSFKQGDSGKKLMQ